MALSLSEIMDFLAKRPQMFVHPVSFATVQSYLRGLSAGLRFAGIEYTWEEYRAAAEARGGTCAAISASSGTSPIRACPMRRWPRNSSRSRRMLMLERLPGQQTPPNHKGLESAKPDLQSLFKKPVAQTPQRPAWVTLPLGFAR